MQIELRDLADIRPYENNPRENDDAVDAVAASMREFGVKQPLVIDTEGVIIVGHTRYKAAQKLGLDKIPVVVATDLTSEQARAYRIADNKTNELASWDFDMLAIELSHLKDDGFDMDLLAFDDRELDKLLASAESDGDATPAETPESLGSDDAIEIIRQAKIILVQYSGGKDSTLALNWAVPLARKYDIPIVAGFVDTGAEFPDLVPYIWRFCKKLDVPLSILHPKKHIVQAFMDKGLWPDSIYRECISTYINECFNNLFFELEAEHGQGNVIIVRGGRSDQKTSRSKSNTYQEVKDRRGVVRLLNPFFAASKEDYEAAMADLEPVLWSGYARGFVRTACWMCPFQRPEQWEALREHYPMLYDQMRMMAHELDWKPHKGDQTPERFHRYWCGQSCDAVTEAETPAA